MKHHVWGLGVQGPVPPPRPMQPPRCSAPSPNLGGGGGGGESHGAGRQAAGLAPCSLGQMGDVEGPFAPQFPIRTPSAGSFHGEFIYNHTERFSHPDYEGRIILVGDPQGSHTASIRIDHLRSSDANVYLCHMREQKKDGQWEKWRNIIGSNLASPQPGFPHFPCSCPQYHTPHGWNSHPHPAMRPSLYTWLPLCFVPNHRLREYQGGKGLRSVRA
uniref:Immunoglobulin V-set domain-containing protein n=1 Tax=Pelusios castaneus TaxID=367368 RepID=A0A8C8S8V6_9SAUR